MMLMTNRRSASIYIYILTMSYIYIFVAFSICVGMSFQLLKWDMIPTRWPTLLANVGINYGAQGRLQALLHSLSTSPRRTRARVNVQSPRRRPTRGRGAAAAGGGARQRFRGARTGNLN